MFPTLPAQERNAACWKIGFEVTARPPFDSALAMLPRAHSDRASRSPDGNPGRLEWLGPRSGQSVVAPRQQLHGWFLAAGIMTGEGWRMCRVFVVNLAPAETILEQVVDFRGFLKTKVRMLNLEAEPFFPISRYV